MKKVKLIVFKSTKPTCKNCSQALIEAEQVKAQMPDVIDLEVYTSMDQEANRFGVISTPTVIINNKIVSIGKPVPSARLKELVEKELN